ncbi:hypothetical protein ACX0HA_04835 [Flavobacterium hauense]
MHFMGKRNKYVIFVLLLALSSCSGKMPEPVQYPKKIKAANYKITFTNNDLWDTVYDSMNVKRVTNRDTVTYIYYKDGKRLNDTLKIYGNSVVFNSEKLNPKSFKKLLYKGREISIYKFHYMDERRVHATCQPVHTLFITDSSGVFIKRVSALSSHVYESNIQKELQQLVIKDSVFFRSY